MEKKYGSWQQFTPLLPGDVHMDRLHDMTQPILTATAKLTHTAHSTARDALRALVRNMNSYYSNLIEGQSTSPYYIDRALAKNFSEQPDIARRQRIAIAHIQAETELERIAAATPQATMTADFIQDAHAQLYSRLDPEDRRLDAPPHQIVAPGTFRTVEVTVGRHLPPVPASIPEFLTAFSRAYMHERTWEWRLIAIACAHHRMAWIHPFPDGNGRATRLQTHVALYPLTGGLWSVNRGLARNKERYYEYLAGADRPRAGDLDGRGNLSERGLVRWVEFFLEMCRNQAEYMASLYDLDGMNTRIGALVQYRMAMEKPKGVNYAGMRTEAALPLRYLFGTGPMTRKEFVQATGLNDRTARNLLRYLLAEGYVTSDSDRGPLRFGLPLRAVDMLLPKLYQGSEAGQ